MNNLIQMDTLKEQEKKRRVFFSNGVGVEVGVGIGVGARFWGWNYGWG